MLLYSYKTNTARQLHFHRSQKETIDCVQHLLNMVKFSQELKMKNVMMVQIYICFQFIFSYIHKILYYLNLERRV